MLSVSSAQFLEYQKPRPIDPRDQIAEHVKQQQRMIREILDIPDAYEVSKVSAMDESTANEPPS